MRIMKPELRVLESAELLAAELAAELLTAAREALAARGRFVLAIPGGSVVSFLARGLPPDVTAEGWHVFWVDERRVPLDHPDSNYRLAAAELLPRLPGAVAHPVRGAVAAYEDEVRPFLPLDLALLGLGEDGHVASLFPGKPELRVTGRLAADVADSPKPPPERVTLTLPVLAGARTVLVAAAGAGKAEVIAHIWNPAADAPADAPVPLLMAGGASMHWLLDKAAASLL